MRRGEIIVIMFMFLLVVGFVIAQETNAEDNQQGSNNDDVICCKVTVVYPNAVPSYELRKRSECANVGSNGEPIVGGNREIVNMNYCKNQSVDAAKVTAKNAVRVTSRNLTKEQVANIVRDRNRLRIEAAAAGECPVNCTCSGSEIKCRLPNGGREMTVVAGKSGNIVVQVKGVNASTAVTLYKDGDKVYGVFKNNETRVVRALPDQVRDRIRERLAQQLEDEEIKLNEDGNYEYTARERVRLFGFIPAKLRVRAEVNSENGEVMKVRNSWWGFLARRQEALLGAGCGTVSPDSRDECCTERGFDFFDTETGQCEFSEEG